MNRISSIFKVVLSLSVIFVLSACGTSGGPPEPITVNLTISSSEDLNPDIENRASPIVIRIYQLAQIDIFNNSDFFALYENDNSILAKDLSLREEFEIKPGESNTKPFAIHSTAKYIAVLAAFRDLDKAQWKSFIEIDPLNPPSLKIDLQAFKVSISNN